MFLYAFLILSILYIKEENYFLTVNISEETKFRTNFTTVIKTMFMIDITLLNVFSSYKKFKNPIDPTAIVH